MTWRLRFSDEVPRVAVLVSKLPHCLFDLLAAGAWANWRAEIPIVISNHDDARENVEALGTTYAHVPVTPETKAASRSSASSSCIERERIDLVVLARYMQVLSDDVRRAVSRTASSTSTTRSCRRSPARGRTTRRTSAA